MATSAIWLSRWGCSAGGDKGAGMSVRALHVLGLISEAFSDPPWCFSGCSLPTAVCLLQMHPCFQLVQVCETGKLFSFSGQSPSVK